MDVLQQELVELEAKWDELDEEIERVGMELLRSRSQRTSGPLVDEQERLEFEQERVEGRIAALKDMIRRQGGTVPGKSSASPYAALSTGRSPYATPTPSNTSSPASSRPPSTGGYGVSYNANASGSNPSPYASLSGGSKPSPYKSTPSPYASLSGNKSAGSSPYASLRGGSGGASPYAALSRTPSSTQTTQSASPYGTTVKSSPPTSSGGSNTSAAGVRGRGSAAAGGRGGGRGAVRARGGVRGRGRGGLRGSQSAGGASAHRATAQVPSGPASGSQVPDNATERIKLLESQVQDMRTQLASREKQHLREMQELQNKLDETRRSDVEAVQTKSAAREWEFEQRLQALQRDADRLRVESGANQAEARDLRNQLSQHHKQAESEKRAAQEMTGTIESLKKRLAQQSQRYAEIERLAQDREKQVKELQDQLHQALNSQKGATDQAHQMLRQREQAMFVEREAAQKRESELRAQLKAVVVDLEAVQKDSDQKKSELLQWAKDREAELLTWGERVGKELERAKKHAAELNAKLQESNSKLADVESGKSREVEILQKQLAARQASLEQAEKRMAAMESDLAQREVRLQMREKDVASVAQHRRRAPPTRPSAPPPSRPPRASATTTVQVTKTGDYDMKKVVMCQRIAKKWLNRKNSILFVAKAYRRSKASRAARHRNHAMREIVTTERDYVHNLESVIRLYVLPLREQAMSGKMLTTNDHRVLFGNIESIYMLNQELLAKLEERLAEWPANQMFGDIFLKMIPLLQLYSKYVGDFDQSNETYVKLDKNKQFHAFCQEVLEKEQQMGRMLNMQSYLIMPVQRLPRYEMLIREVLKYTDESHVDAQNLQECYDKVRALVTEINEKKRVTENTKLVLEVNEKLRHLPRHFVLLQPSRRFVKEGDALQDFGGGDNESVHVFLFNDIFLVTRKTRKYFNYELDLHLRDMIDYDKVGEHGFTIVTHSGQIVLQFSGASERDEWIGALENCTDALHKTLPMLGRKKSHQRLT